jgi:hypothetical protein
MTADDAQRRLARAHEAQVLWGQTPPEQRARALRPLHRAIAGRIDDIVAVISCEVGKPAMDALAGDVMVTLEQLGFYERHAAHLLRSRKRGNPWFFFSGTRFKEFMEPHGVVRLRALLKLRHSSGLAARIPALRGLWVLLMLLGWLPCVANSAVPAASGDSPMENAQAPIVPVQRCRP